MRNYGTQAVGYLLILLSATYSVHAADVNGYSSLYEKPLSPPACDTANPEVKIIEFPADWSEIDNPLFRIFCVKPGDYKTLGQITIASDGTPGLPRWLQYYRVGDTGEHPHAMQTADLAAIDSINFTGANHWVVRRLAIQDPTHTSARRRVRVVAHNSGETSSGIIMDNLLIEGGNRAMIRITDASKDITLQNNLIQNPIFPANSPENARTCLFIRAKDSVGNTERIHIVNNEFKNCTEDGIQLISDDLTSPSAGILASVIENNDFYNTSDIYLDVNGQPDPAGPLSCSENGIDVKIANHTSTPENRLLIAHNRFWGYRRSYVGVTSCSNNGSQNSPAITVHHNEADYLLVKDNIITDAESGIAIIGNGFGDKPDHISIVGNRLYDVANKSNPRGALILDRGKHTEVYFNTIIQSDEVWDLAKNLELDIRANLVVKAGSENGNTGGTTHTSHQVFVDSTNIDIGGNDSQFAVTTRADGAQIAADSLFYANNASACTDGSQDGCVVYRALTTGTLAATKPVLPTNCGDTVQDGTVTVEAVLCACTYYRKLVSGPELMAIPYCESAEITSPAFASVITSSQVGVTAERGIDDSLPPGTGAQDDVWQGYSIPAYAGAYQGNIPPDTVIADAGIDRTASETMLATLDASESLPGGTVSYSWNQTGGTPVTLNNATTSSPEFTAPQVTADTPLTFELIVDGPQAETDSDSVTVIVQILDTDSDAMSDLWETEQFGTLSVLPDTDADGDGTTNVEEFFAQSNPLEGDVNGDSQLNVADYLLLQQHVLGLIQLTTEQQDILDIAPAGGNGILDAGDIGVLRQRVLAAN